jgi:quercetin dioxygenase-like cupin family protein
VEGVERERGAVVFRRGPAGTGRGPCLTRCNSTPLPSPVTQAQRFITAAEMQVEPSPWGPHEWLSRAGLTEADGLMLVRVRMPPGTAHQFHRHPEMEEIIYVESGVAEQWVDRERRMLRAGEIAHIPRGVVHGTYNGSADTLVFLAILSPAECAGPVLVDVHREAPWSELRAPMPLP